VFVRDRQTGQTVRVNLATGGAQANDNSNGPALSADGRFIAFYSLASNLVAGDTNGTLDVFVHDRQTGQTTRVSVASDGTQGNGDSSAPVLSADGRFVAFASAASNLVPGDTNGSFDAFVHDRQTGQTIRVSVASNGAQSDGGGTLPALSADGRFVAFESASANLVAGDTNGFPDIFVHDRQTAQTTRVSVATNGAQSNSASNGPSLSADGRFVAFRSVSSDLVAGDTNNTGDIFVHDRQTGQTTRVSVASNGAQANGFNRLGGVSADGRFVAFESEASNLVAGDTNLTTDVFVHESPDRADDADKSCFQWHPARLQQRPADGECGRAIRDVLLGSRASRAGRQHLLSGRFRRRRRSIDQFDGSDRPCRGRDAERRRLVRLRHVVDRHDHDAVDHDQSACWWIGQRHSEFHCCAQYGSSTDRDDRRSTADRDGSTRMRTRHRSHRAARSRHRKTLRSREHSWPPIPTVTRSRSAWSRSRRRGTVVLTNSSTGAFTYTPALNQFGGDSFTFQASAGGEASNVAIVSITVTPVNDAPVATAGTLAAIEDTPATGLLAATDVDGNALTFNLASQPAHGSVGLNLSTGAYTYTPGAELQRSRQLYVRRS
jgi:Tol biopolymer transport system component